MPPQLAHNLIDQLVALSQRYGADPAFCLAGGGNTSVKSEGRLWVKASGVAMAEITSDGFVEMDRTALVGMTSSVCGDDIEQREAEFMARLLAGRVHPGRGQRPSVETLIHELIPRRFVVHTHPALVNALTCAVNGEQLTRHWFGDTVFWQPYVDPGVTLAQSLERRLAGMLGQSGPIIVFLENHGLIVAADSVQEIDQVTVELTGFIEKEFVHKSTIDFAGPAFPNTSRHLGLHLETAQRVFPEHKVVSERSDEIRAITGSEGGMTVALSGPLTPDQIVYCRAMPMWMNDPAATPAAAETQWRSALSAYEAKHGMKPWVALLAGAGLIAVRESEHLAQTTCDVYCDAAKVYRYADSLGGVQAMPPRDVAFIENWEVESYRRSVAADQLASAV